MKMHKKGAIEQLSGLIIPLIAIGIMFAVGLIIISEIQDNIDDDKMCLGGATWNPGNDSCTGGGASNETTTTANATKETISAISDIPGWLSIIVITVIGALLIGLVSVFRRK